MALALPHQIFDGTHFHDLWTQVYWWTLYFGTLAAVLPHTPRSCASQYKPSVAAANGSPPKAPTGHSPTTFAVFPHGDDRRRGWASPRSPGCSKTLNTHRGEAALVTLQWVPDQRLWSDMPRPAVVLVLAEGPERVPLAGSGSALPNDPIGRAGSRRRWSRAAGGSPGPAAVSPVPWPGRRGHG